MDTPDQNLPATILQLQIEHRSLLHQANAIIALLRRIHEDVSPEPLLDAFDCFQLQVESHVRREDVELYPRLEESRNKAVGQLLDSMKGEVFFLSDRLAAFTKHWSCCERIVAETEEFVREAREILGLFAHRLDREEQIFLKLLE